MKGSIKDFIKNAKLEIFLIVLLIIFCVIIKLNLFGFTLNIDLGKYFTQDRLNGVASFCAITIGVYIAVITIIATSEIGITKPMLEQKLDKGLINVIIAGIIENVVSVVFAIFIPQNDVTSCILIVFIVASIVSFVKFVIMLFFIFKGNMEAMAKVIDENDRYKDDIMTYLDKIARYCDKHRDEE